MRRAGSPSWEIRLDRWNQSLDWALWFRAAERIDVPAEGVVPGPLDIETLPDPSADARDADLAAGWKAWWHTLVTAPAPEWPPDRDRPPSELAFGPPYFPGLTDWPALRQVVTHRWREAHEWHTARKRAGLAAGIHRGDGRTNRIVDELEHELGRKARPFVLDVLLLPVRDDQVRPVNATRYLVPERLHDGPQWPQLLRTLITPQF